MMPISVTFILILPSYLLLGLPKNLIPLPGKILKELLAFHSGYMSCPS
jgi:hypothetical protein